MDGAAVGVDGAVVGDVGALVGFVGYPVGAPVLGNPVGAFVGAFVGAVGIAVGDVGDGVFFVGNDVGSFVGALLGNVVEGYPVGLPVLGYAVGAVAAPAAATLSHKMMERMFAGWQLVVFDRFLQGRPKAKDPSEA